MRLQSHDQFARVARFQPERGEFAEMSRHDARGLLDQPLRGHFSWSFGPLAVLYRRGAVLRFRVGEVDWPLNQTRIAWSGHGPAVRIAVDTQDGSRAFEYAAAREFDFDFTAGADGEDFDFGLFVSNVAADAQRADRLYRDELEG